jgi:hypothetical protein
VALIRGKKKGKKKGGQPCDIMMPMFMFTLTAFEQLVGFS